MSWNTGCLTVASLPPRQVYVLAHDQYWKMKNLAILEVWQLLHRVDVLSIRGHI